VYLIFNKIDAYQFVQKEDDDLSPRTKENLSLEELKATWMAKSSAECIFISAKEKHNFEEFKQNLYANTKRIHMLRYPYDTFLY